MQEPVANPWPESPQPPPVQEANCLVSLANPKFEAARQVARLLARHNEQGFQHIKFVGQPVTETAQHGQMKITYRALLRLALIGDQDLLSKEALKRASHCGGVKPNPPFLEAVQDTPDLSDAGNAAYNCVVNKLLQDCWSNLAKEWIYSRRCRIGYIAQLKREEKANLIEAALAAADYAWKQQEGHAWTWESLRGGVWGDGDLLLGSTWFRNFRMMGYQPEKRVRLILNQGGDV